MPALCPASFSCAVYHLWHVELDFVYLCTRSTAGVLLRLSCNACSIWSIQLLLCMLMCHRSMNALLSWAFMHVCHILHANASSCDGRPSSTCMISSLFTQKYALPLGYRLTLAISCMLHLAQPIEQITYRQWFRDI